MSYGMDALQAWLVLCKRFKGFGQFQTAVIRDEIDGTQNASRSDTILAEAVEVLSRHLNPVMIGEDDNDVIVSAAECQDEDWDEHLNWLLARIEESNTE